MRPHPAAHPHWPLIRKYPPGPFAARTKTWPFFKTLGIGPRPRNRTQTVSRSAVKLFATDWANPDAVYSRPLHSVSSSLTIAHFAADNNKTVTLDTYLKYLKSWICCCCCCYYKLLNMVSVNKESSGTFAAAATNEHACHSLQIGNLVIVVWIFCFVWKSITGIAFFGNGGRFRYFRLRQRTLVYKCN